MWFKDCFKDKKWALKKIFGIIIFFRTHFGDLTDKKHRKSNILADFK